MPRPKRSEPGASIHVVVERSLKREMEKVWRKTHGRMPQGAWQRFIESAIRDRLYHS